MSTELFEAKAIADDIHDIADVPEKLNTHIYQMTLHMIGHLIVEMDKRGITMNEQRTRMGRKKDELIGELIRLREEGVLRGERNPHVHKEGAGIRVNAGMIRKVG